LPHGIDTGLFSPAPEPDSPSSVESAEQPPSVLFFANVIRRKGIFSLVDAFPAVLREIPGAKLVIAGDGSDLPGAQRRVASLGFAKQAEFLGKQERVNAPTLYRNCSVYCLPSFGEPHATTLIEAMSCGKPVVVTDAGGLSYLVSPEGGKRVPVGDSVALSTALVDLLQSPEQRKAMGRHNRMVVERLMSWDSVVKRLEEIYVETIQRRLARRDSNNQKDALPLEPGSGTSVGGPI
jgi:glycosyltransferase involved in cell wall biosynthesis